MPGFKKTIAFILLLLVAVPLTGFILFYIQELSIKAEMKRAFKSKELSTVHLTQLTWYDKDEELIINGSLFDVSSIRQLPDGTYIAEGLYDHQENELYQLMEASAEDNQKSPLLLEYASCFVSIHEGTQLFTKNLLHLFKRQHGAYCEHLKPQFQPGILLPPPKQLLFLSGLFI